jgi:hypothetical protein
VRLDEHGDEVPATLGEYRDLCAQLGGENCAAVSFLDGKISESQRGRDELVVVTDVQARWLLMPMLCYELGAATQGATEDLGAAWAAWAARAAAAVIAEGPAAEGSAALHSTTAPVRSVALAAVNLVWLARVQRAAAEALAEVAVAEALGLRSARVHLVLREDCAILSLTINGQAPTEAEWAVLLASDIVCAAAADFPPVTRAAS